MNMFASNTLQGLSPFELVFARKPRELASFEMPKLQSIEPEYREFFKLLMDKAKMYRDMDLEWCIVQTLELGNKNKMLTNIETFAENDIVYLLAQHVSAIQSNAQKFKQNYMGLLAIDTKIDDTHYLLKDITSHTLKGDYHINRLKRAGKVTPEVFIKNYEQLCQQIGLPIVMLMQLAPMLETNEQLSIAA